MVSRNFTDEEVIVGILTNDIRVYQYLDLAYREQVLNYVQSNSGTIEDGEEHYQDVIVEIYFKCNSGQYKLNSFESYFWTVTKRRWIDKLRKNKLSFVPLEQSFENMLEKVDETIALNERLLLLIEKYLVHLTDEEREYLNLYYYAMNSIKSLSINFKTTSGYAQLKLHRIRTKLRRLIENDPEYATLSNLY